MSAIKITLAGLMAVVGLGEAVAQDAMAFKTVIESSSLQHYRDPLSSIPGGLKQSLAGLGFLDPTPRLLRRTTTTPSTKPVLTHQEWPLEPGLLPKGWVGPGLPGFYSPPVEPVPMLPPDFESTRVREGKSYVYFKRMESVDKWGRAESPNRLQPLPTEIPNYLRPDTEAAILEQPLFEEAMFEVPQFDLRNVELSALRRSPTGGKEVVAGGWRYERRNTRPALGVQAAPRRRFKNLSYWEANVAPNDSRSSRDPNLAMEVENRNLLKTNFELRNPEQRRDPRDPAPSYSVRPFYQPEYRGARSAGGK